MSQLRVFRISIVMTYYDRNLINARYNQHRLYDRCNYAFARFCPELQPIHQLLHAPRFSVVLPLILHHLHDILNLNTPHTLMVSTFAFIAGAALHIMPHNRVYLAARAMTNGVGRAEDGYGGSIYSG